MQIIKLNIDIELLREQIIDLSMAVMDDPAQFNAREGVVNLLEEIIDQAEGVQTPALTMLEEAEGNQAQGAENNKLLSYQGVPIVWSADKLYKYRPGDNDNWGVYSVSFDGCEEWTATVVTETIAKTLVETLNK